MGRQAYLVRMALGRSAYESTENAATSTQEPSSATSSPYTQHYDTKANPQNALTTHLTTCQISAKNEVLAAVGVCERKTQAEHDQNPAKVRFSDEEWVILRDAENDHGELIKMIAECSRNALTWWIVALRGRIQVGLLPVDVSFSQILLHEWTSCTGSGVSGVFNYLSAGAAPELTAQVLLTVFDWVIGDRCLELERRILRLRASRRHRYTLLQWLRFGNRSLTVLFHLFVYPLSCYSTLQQLGLVSTSQTLPMACLLPWHPASPLRWATYQRQDRPSHTSGLLWSCLSSPGSLWVMATLLHDVWVASYGHVPLFEQGAILGPHQPRSTSTMPQSSLFTRIKKVRDGILRLLGWSTDQALQQIGNTPDNTLTDGTNDGAVASQKSVSRRLRVNELSMLPSHFLALNLDNLLWNIVLLPFDALCVRTLTSSYLASSTAQTYIGQQYPGRLSQTLARRGNSGGGGWSEAGAYASKIGLCMALEFMVGTTVWSGAYAWARYAGIRRFHWGST